MKIDQAGIDLIKGFEGLRLQAYQDSAGVWTIGYGSTRYKNGTHVKKGDRLLNEECAADLFAVTLEYFDNTVNGLVKVPLSQAQHNSLVSFTYNEGDEALAESTLLKKLNAGNYQGAADEFLNWVKITDPETHIKEISADLVRRRKIERKPFITPTAQNLKQAA